MTEIDHSLFSVEVSAKISHLRYSALWKWCALFHPMVIFSLFAIVILVQNVPFPLMPSFQQLCHDCHSMRSQVAFLRM